MVRHLPAFLPRQQQHHVGHFSSPLLSCFLALLSQGIEREYAELDTVWFMASGAMAVLLCCLHIAAARRSSAEPGMRARASASCVRLGAGVCESAACHMPHPPTHPMCTPRRTATCQPYLTATSLLVVHSRLGRPAAFSSTTLTKSPPSNSAWTSLPRPLRRCRPRWCTCRWAGLEF